MLLSPVMKWYVKWPGAVLREEDRATSRQSEVCLTASCSKIKEIWVHLLIWNENLVTICWLHIKNSISEHMTDKFFLVTGLPLETSASPLAPKLKTIAGSDMCCACVIVRTPLSANLWMHVQSQMSVWTCKRRIRMWNLLLLRALQGINLVCHCELTLILVTTLLNFTKFCASWLLP